MRLGIAFAWFGLFWGSFAVASYDLVSYLGLGVAGFGTLLSLAVGGGVLANLLGSALTRRWGPPRVLAASVGVWSLFLLALSAAQPRLLFMGVYVLGVGFSALVDQGINIAGTAAYGDRPGRLARLHALWNLGAVGGAALMAGVLTAGLAWRWAWAAFGLTGLVLALWLNPPQPAPAGSSGPGNQAGAGSGLGLLAREGLLLLAVAFMLGALVEGGVSNWGVLYLRSHLSIGVLAGASGYVAGQLLATAARVWLGGRAAARGGMLGAAVGTGAAAVGLLIEVFGPDLLEPVGLALAVLGISLCWPLVMAAVSRTGDRMPAVVGTLVALAYLSFVVGPSTVGWVSAFAGLRAGLLLLAALAVISATAAALQHRIWRLT